MSGQVSRRFEDVRLTKSAFSELWSIFDDEVSKCDLDEHPGAMPFIHDHGPTFSANVVLSEARWTHDDRDDFLFSMDGSVSEYYWSVDAGIFHGLSVSGFSSSVAVSVEMLDRRKAGRLYNRVCDVILRPEFKIERPPPPPVEKKPAKVFIGHGGASDWLALANDLHGNHGIETIAFESGARAGHTIRDIITEMSYQAQFALLVYTGEDEQGDGGMRARQNVIHETGLFQGKLGYSRAIMLVEEGVELFSNVQGIIYLKFEKGKILATVGDILAVLKREQLL